MTSRILTKVPRTGLLEHMVLGKPFWIMVLLALGFIFTLLTN